MLRDSARNNGSESRTSLELGIAAAKKHTELARTSSNNGRHKTTPVASKPQYRVLDLADFLACQLPPREELLSPWLLTQSLNMLYAWRGVGKTHVALGISLAVSSGGEFLGWKAAAPHRVLYLDGEMPGPALQQRLRQLVAPAAVRPPAGFLKLLTPDLQEAGMPDLATHLGQMAIEQMLDQDTALIVVDNLSSLMRAGAAENEAESWSSVQAWGLRMRQQGRSVLYVHHAGKSGAQRGTSKREDLLDTSVCLKHPADCEQHQGARFEVHFEKSRNQCGEAIAPLEVALVTIENGQQSWSVKTLEDSTSDRVVQLAKEGLSQAEIAIEVGRNRSTVSRALHKAKANGRITTRVGTKGR